MHIVDAPDVGVQRDGPTTQRLDLLDGLGGELVGDVDDRDVGAGLAKAIAVAFGMPPAAPVTRATASVRPSSSAA